MNSSLFGFLCACTPGASLALTPTTGRESFGEVNRVIFQRTKNGTVVNEFVIATTDPKLKASWAALVAASDSTKAIFSPYTNGFKIPKSEATEFGGDGTTVGGIPIIVSQKPVKAEATFYELFQSTVAELKKLYCEDLSVFFISECGNIAGLSDDPTNPTTFKGFPISKRTFNITSKEMTDRVNPESNGLSWMFPFNWSDKFTVLRPTDFNAVDDADLNTIA